MLKNNRFAGQKVMTPFGMIKYDEEGITRDLTKEQEDQYLKIDGYSRVEESKDKTEDKEKPKKEGNTQKKKEPKKKVKKFTKKELENKTVDEIEEVAKELGIKLEGSVKREKIKEILDAQ